MMINSKYETHIIVALTHAVEADVRSNSTDLAAWLDNARTYTWKNFKVFYFKSFGYFRWDDEVAELTKLLVKTLTTEFAIKIHKQIEDEAGDVTRFRLNEILES
jgi:hypothetical protein